MIKYEDKQCPACGKQFEPNDDVVFCPECGTPHHRECYQKNRECSLHDQHSTLLADNSNTKQEKTKNQVDQNKSQEIKCGVCGASNPANSLFCRTCGSILNSSSKANQNVAIYPEIQSDKTIGDLSVKELSTYVGPNSVYYLYKFKKMTTGVAFTFNFIALLLPTVFFLHRKMYIYGIISGLISIVSGLLALFITCNNLFYTIDPNYLYLFEFLAQIFYVVNIGIFLLSGFFANSIYMSKVFNKIKSIKKSTDEQSYFQNLAKKGGVSYLLPSIFVGASLLSNFLFLALLRI